MAEGLFLVTALGALGFVALTSVSVVKGDPGDVIALGAVLTVFFAASAVTLVIL